jgi:glycosyltransferase involved in cell wall biosynthesis
MKSETKHISVCVCTYKRPEFLKRLLNALGEQETGGLFTYSIVVADNDRLQSGEAVVEDFRKSHSVAIRYCVEGRQNIALARNQAIENADGDFVAFIDDDEFPAGNWLLNLFRACEQYQVDGVLGPVRRHFDETPPKWIVKGEFYERPIHPTGLPVLWSAPAMCCCGKRFSRRGSRRSARNFATAKTRIFSGERSPAGAASSGAVTRSPTRWFLRCDGSVPSC